VRRIVAHLPSAVRVSRLRNAAQEYRKRSGEPVTIEVADSLRDVRGRLGMGGVATLISDPFSSRKPVPPHRPGVPRDLEMVRKERPHRPIGIYCDPLPAPIVLALGALGIDELVIAGEEDSPRNLLRVISNLLSSDLVERFAQTLPPAVAPEIRTLIVRIVEHAESAPTVSQLAQWAFTTPGNLWRRFKGADLPPPSFWLRAARLFRALSQVEAGKGTFQQAAVRFGYGTGANLADACSRFLGTGPTQSIEYGGSGLVLDRVRSAVSTADRTAGPDAGNPRDEGE
jgi:AraC-like DNA-binding protein